jgi:hypothetical protein
MHDQPNQPTDPEGDRITPPSMLGQGPMREPVSLRVIIRALVRYFVYGATKLGDTI